ncbi:universal stress protein [Arthrobacter sp. Br18]|uniref:universal stress protein n=1 Tax=Arthrobacter sp. Br18 TaxID=1312954 RepID=UPI000478CFB6|nr:universal stress protein [Arthrobacter sp. Br18]
MEQKQLPRIVVGVDGSAQSVEALRYAQRIAPLFDATIHAVSAWEYPAEYAGYVPLGSDNFSHTTRDRLDTTLAAAFGDHLPEGLESSVEFAHPAKALAKASEGAAMLIVGRRGHGTFHGLLLGSVSAACVSHARCPVLVVHPSEEPAEELREEQR